MGYRIPFKIMSGAHAASTTYPYAISLFESVRVYDATNDVVLNRKEVASLVAVYRLRIHELFGEVFILYF